jgi:hypothetical protein
MWPCGKAGAVRCGAMPYGAFAQPLIRNEIHGWHGTALQGGSQTGPRIVQKGDHPALVFVFSFFTPQFILSPRIHPHASTPHSAPRGPTLISLICIILHLITMQFKAIAALLAVAGIATAQTTDYKSGKAHIDQGMCSSLSPSEQGSLHRNQKETKGQHDKTSCLCS